MNHLGAGQNLRLGALICAFLAGGSGACGDRRPSPGPPSEESKKAAPVEKAPALPPGKVRPVHRENALEKIDAAEKAGRLDRDAAWLFRLQAVFEPAKLPAAYRSPEAIRCATTVMKGFLQARPLLKPETVRAARPYGVRPTHPESIFSGRGPARQALPEGAESRPGLLFAQAPDPSSSRPTRNKTLGDWFGAGCASAPVTVWSRLSPEDAQAAASSIDRRAVWAKFKRVMPFEPVSDANLRDEAGELNQEMDGDLDIYRVPRNPYLTDADGSFWGLCVPIQPTTMSATWILVDQELAGIDLESTLAHELFHSFACALDRDEEVWWDEACATWAEEVVDRQWQTEQVFLTEAFDSAAFTLKTLTSEEGGHPYGAYLFPFYLAARFGEGIIGQIWSDCSQAGPNALSAVRRQLDAAASGFDEAFKEFALMNYNDREPFTRRYPEILDVFSCHGEDRIMLKDRSEARMIDMKPLSARYLHVYNDGIDGQKTPAVTFHLEDCARRPRLSVQAVLLRQGRHTVEDWTGRKERVFCLNEPRDRFDDIVIVMASTETERTLEKVSIPVELGYAAACDVDWMGTLTFTAVYQCGRDDPGAFEKTGRWQRETGAAWEDQFTRFAVKTSTSFRVTATVPLALKAVSSQVSGGERELMETLGSVLGGAVYTQTPLRGAFQISLDRQSVETTTIRPSTGPGTSTITTSTAVHGGGALAPGRLTALRGPRLTVTAEKGEYTLDINFAAPEVIGTTVIESGSAGPAKSPASWEADPLFDSYHWRDQWNQPVLRGTYKGSTIQGRWSRPRISPPDGRCGGEELEYADLRVEWSLTKVR